jgi:hypothetical protein
MIFPKSKSTPPHVTRRRLAILQSLQATLPLTFHPKSIFIMELFDLVFASGHMVKKETIQRRLAWPQHMDDTL